MYDNVSMKRPARVLSCGRASYSSMPSTGSCRLDLLDTPKLFGTVAFVLVAPFSNSMFFSVSVLMSISRRTTIVMNI
jgi:hypothetical protein